MIRDRISPGGNRTITGYRAILHTVKDQDRPVQTLTSSMQDCREWADATLRGEPGSSHVEVFQVTESRVGFLVREPDPLPVVLPVLPEDSHA